MENLVYIRMEMFGGGSKKKNKVNRYYFDSLPDEIMLIILRHLGIRDLDNMGHVCKRLLNIISMEASLKSTTFHQEDLEFPKEALLRHWDSTSGYQTLKHCGLPQLP